MSSCRTYKMKALTDIWTGDHSGRANRLITTGLLGSIRWWFEVVVRGLGGSACDPSHHQDNEPGPCPESTKRPDEPGHHCVVCELFGCTHWARKFRFDVLTGDGKLKQDQITPGPFQLRFTPLRPICGEEWALLHLTLRLIAEYGALGGKTVYKPSEELALADAPLDAFDDALVLQRPVRGSPLNRNDKVLRIDGKGVTSRTEFEATLASRPAGVAVGVEVERNRTRTAVQGWSGKRHHQDHGLVRLEEPPHLPSLKRRRLQTYVSDRRWRHIEHGDFAWASLRNFWSVADKCLTRSAPNKCSYNAVLGRKQDKTIKERNGNRVVRWSDLFVDKNDASSKWLAGSQRESKKIVSVKDPLKARRTFGFVEAENELDHMRHRLKEKAWGDLRNDDFVKGDEVLERLLGNRESA